MGSRKMILMRLFAGRKQRCRHREQICGHSRGRRGWDKQRSIETYTLPNIRQSQWELSVYHGELTTVLCDNLEEWVGVGGRFKREGTYVDLWLIHVDVSQTPTQHYKAITLQIKIKKRKKNPISNVTSLKLFSLWRSHQSDLSLITYLIISFPNLKTLP